MEQEETYLEEYRVVGNKVYILKDQLFISDSNMFIYIHGEKVFVNQIKFDENGIYCFIEDLDKITDKCYNNHKIWCKQCWGCAVRYCKFRCKCVTWE